MKIKYINTPTFQLDDLSFNHNIGIVSDTVFNTISEAYNNLHTSYTTIVAVGLRNTDEYLSLSVKKFIPLVGNRVAKFANDFEISYYYLILDGNGKLIDKKLIHKTNIENEN